MPIYSVPRRIWRVIYPPLIYLALSIVVTIIILFVFGAYVGIRETSGGNVLAPQIIAEETVAFAEKYLLWFQFASSVIGLALFLPIWLKTRKRLDSFKGNQFSWTVALLVCGAGAGLNLLIICLITVLDLTSLFPSYEVISEALTSGNLLVQILAMGIAAPVVEEICFRGIVLNRLLYWTPKWVAIIIGSVLFGLIHLNSLQILYATVIGVVFSFLYVRFRNLCICIIGHMAFNLASIIFNAINPDISIWAIFILAVIVVGGCIWVLLKCPVPVATETRERENIAVEQG